MEIKKHIIKSTAFNIVSLLKFLSIFYVANLTKNGDGKNNKN